MIGETKNLDIMEDHGLVLDENGVKIVDKVPWWKDKKWWLKLVANALAMVCLTVVMLFLILCFDIIGEISARNEHIKKCETVVVTGIHDNSIPQYTDGDKIYSKQYIYYLDYVDQEGIPHRQEFNNWSPWLNGTILADSATVHVRDTIRLYRFSSGGILDINGNRVVVEKGGVFYE